MNEFAVKKIPVAKQDGSGSKFEHDRVLKSFNNMRTREWFIELPVDVRVRIESVHYTSSTEEDFLSNVQKILNLYNKKRA